MANSAPRFASNDGVIEAVRPSLGDALLDAWERNFEVTLTAGRERIVEVLRTLRDEHDYQMLADIAGVDYPDRAERFEVVYHLLSMTRNHRIRVKVSTDEASPVPSCTGLWYNANWLEREVFDMFGVLFSGHPDLRRILTDYGFKGHPFRKDFPLTGHVELHWSEEEGRVMYEPVNLPQEHRTFDFLSPWEGADYTLPGDEKAPVVPASTFEVKTTERPSQTGAGPRADANAVPVSAGSPARKEDGPAAPAPAPTEHKTDTPGQVASDGNTLDAGPEGKAGSRVSPLVAPYDEREEAVDKAAGEPTPGQAHKSTGRRRGRTPGEES